MFSFSFSFIYPSVIGRFLEALHGWIITEFSEKSQGVHYRKLGKNVTRVFCFYILPFFQLLLFLFLCPVEHHVPTLISP